MVLDCLGLDIENWPLEKRMKNVGIAMKTLLALLYCGLLTSANPTLAQDYSVANDLRSGDMRKLIFAAPQDVSQIPFTTPEGEEVTLADFAGKTVVLNFWATWCAPCRKEMPSLSELRTVLGGETFDVVAVATGPKNEPAKIAKFFAKNNVTNLPVFLDPKSRFANEMGVRGLPITVILNAQGQEIARMRGDAEWASDNAKDVLMSIIEIDQNS